MRQLSPRGGATSAPLIPVAVATPLPEALRAGRRGPQAVSFFVRPKARPVAGGRLSKLDTVPDA